MYHGGPRARDAAAEGALSGIEGVAKDVVAHVESVDKAVCGRTLLVGAKSGLSSAMSSAAAGALRELELATGSGVISAVNVFLGFFIYIATRRAL